jgi:hypothetical protein
MDLKDLSYADIEQSYVEEALDVLNMKMVN